MDIKAFDFSLPDGLIARHPAERRDSSRLMVMDRATGELSHETFGGLKRHLREGDLLILNDTKVRRARLIGNKETGGVAELLVIESGIEKDGWWKCLVRPSKGLKRGARIFFEDGVVAEAGHGIGGGFHEMRFNAGVEDVLDRIGLVPLPPYLGRDASADDSIRYQTVFARVPGAVAAPTAGLHFTEGLLDEIRGGGVKTMFITLHTGPGTFLPVRVSNVEGHRMMEEHYDVAPDVFDEVKKAVMEKRRVIAVGTTALRALEASVSAGLERPVLTGKTDIFIYPGFVFKAVDGLVTNFHLPGSTLLMLASAFAGRERMLAAYGEAIKHGYRFFSYGDAMLIA